MISVSMYNCGTVLPLLDQNALAFLFSLFFFVRYFAVMSNRCYGFRENLSESCSMLYYHRHVVNHAFLLGPWLFSMKFPDIIDGVRGEISR